MFRLCTIAFALSLLHAQAPLEFEAATVKVSNTGNGIRGGCHGIDSHYTALQAASAPPLGRCVITDARLGHLIRFAFDLRNGELNDSGHDWISGGFERYNVEAKAEDPPKTTEAELRAMLQALLVERFRLKFHRETIEEQGFALVVARNGPKLQPSKGGDAEIRINNNLGKPVPGQPVVVVARNYSMAGLVGLLSGINPHPVVDKTGLSGVYDFTLTWDDAAGPSLSTAIQEQLGLKFESQKVPVLLLVVDSAEKPSGN